MAATQVVPGQTVASDIFLNEKMEAAISSAEISTSPGNDTKNLDSNLLVVSPYTEREHLLDLRTLDAENALLARALVHMRALRPDYATANYSETFNWTEIIEQHLESLVREGGHQWKNTCFFIVAFRSQIPPTTKYADLGAMDKAAHAEATASGGFLKYWFGTPDQDGRNLATCIWRSEPEAKEGGKGPAHRKAAGATRHLYTHWKIERYRLTICDDLQSWDLVDWAD
ncbi:uncharacterized protein BCR38DRAFT_346465 [Pseudomassariella vexata]|uniref:Uncharacterized protein n=1 Tax=Pseudomassariella vexata TaxID=1141098 RepID=A0A1Y2DSY5_9PEZI|nr:uncharacterized protein BCR38DRAFT_346465 [Pseudomassariella vexata]ORY62380.1 hypothetical protein BCR38DRAFT_346465 [Pseudomassariella vexata]